MVVAAAGVSETEAIAFVVSSLLWIVYRSATASWIQKQKKRIAIKFDCIVKTKRVSPGARRTGLINECGVWEANERPLEGFFIKGVWAALEQVLLAKTTKKTLRKVANAVGGKTKDEDEVVQDARGGTKDYYSVPSSQRRHDHIGPLDDIERGKRFFQTFTGNEWQTRKRVE